MKTNEIITDYEQQTGGEMAETMCADCTYAIWQIVDNASRAEDDPAYSFLNNIALTAYCTARSKSMRGPVYACSGYAPNTEAQAADIGNF